MEYCPECGTEVRAGVAYCPGCGTDLTEYREWESATGVGTDIDGLDDRSETDANGSDSGVAANDRAVSDENQPGERQRDNRGQDAGQPTADREQDTGQSQPGRGRDGRDGRGAGGSRRQPQSGHPRQNAPDEQSHGGARDGHTAPSSQGNTAPPPQGSQSERGRQAGAPAGTDQQWHGQDRRTPTGADAAPATGAVNRGPSLFDRIKALPFKRSAAAGAALYVVTFLVTYVTFVVDALVIHSDHDLSVSTFLPLTDITSWMSLDMWQFVGWLLYSGHNVPIERTAGDSAEPIEVLGADFWMQFPHVPQLVTPALYTLIPIVVLAAGGLVFVRRLDADGTAVSETSDAALLGGSVLVGYVALAAAGTFLVGISDGATSSGPVLQDAVLWTALFAGGAGAAGGVAAHSLGDDASVETAPSSDSG